MKHNLRFGLLQIAILEETLYDQHEHEEDPEEDPEEPEEPEEDPEEDPEQGPVEPEGTLAKLRISLMFARCSQHKS